MEQSVWPARSENPKGQRIPTNRVRDTEELSGEPASILKANGSGEVKMTFSLLSGEKAAMECRHKHNLTLKNCGFLDGKSHIFKEEKNASINLVSVVSGTVDKLS